MKKKTIFLHIGAPKTGTTSIQEYLRIHTDRLFADGFLVPHTSRSNGRNHKLIVNYCIDRLVFTPQNIRYGLNSYAQLRKFKKGFAQRFRDEIDAFPGEYVILSSEQCYENLTTEDQIRCLYELLDGLADRVHILFYIREQAQTLCSAYSTQMKNGKTGYIPSVHEFSKMDRFDYNKRILLWEKVFGINHIQIRIYDPAHLAEGNVILDFSQAIGIPTYSNERVSLNQTLNAKQSEFVRQINLHIPRVVDRKVNHIRDNLIAMVAKIHIASPPISAFINHEYQQVFAESNTHLARRYFQQDHVPFTRPRLADIAIDQDAVMTLDECRDFATQFIKAYSSQNEDLCKCIASIFQVAYHGDEIPYNYVQSINEGISLRARIKRGVDAVPLLKRGVHKMRLYRYIKDE